MTHARLVLAMAFVLSRGYASDGDLPQDSVGLGLVDELIVINAELLSYRSALKSSSARDRAKVTFDGTTSYCRVGRQVARVGHQEEVAWNGEGVGRAGRLYRMRSLTSIPLGLHLTIGTAYGHRHLGFFDHVRVPLRHPQLMNSFWHYIIRPCIMAGIPLRTIVIGFLHERRSRRIIVPMAATLINSTGGIPGYRRPLRRHIRRCKRNKNKCEEFLSNFD